MKAALIGGGVIGAGWAARFLLHGWDVALIDADALAEEKVRRVVAAAQVSLPQLYDVSLPSQGSLSMPDTLADALLDADWVQESVPEVLELKQQVYDQVFNTVAEGVPVASSTSGFKPSQLAEQSIRPEQILVCHPFNPVYLIPLVEVVGAPSTSVSIKQFCMTTLVELGMQPIEVRREIDAHIADRLLEAVWREALWLIKDGVATTEEIDDVIRYGFGPRWAQMGLFETYRIAGGEGGMRKFLAHFGPALQWPWSKLTDVPELTADLIELIATQSDQQSSHMSITELEEQRDRNLVAIFKALKETNYGVGQLLNNYDRITGSK
jgi:carnitine 3-dehydrogenase